MIASSWIRFSYLVFATCTLFHADVHPRGGADMEKRAPMLQQNSGTQLVIIGDSLSYSDGRPHPCYRLNARDHGIVVRHGSGPHGCDSLGARDVWVWESEGMYYMHYDGAGTRGWLSCLAVSTDMRRWTARGTVLDLGEPGQPDAASASYAVTFQDRGRWHMFYLGTPHTSPPPDRVPAFPYLTMKADGPAPTGPWTKRYEITPFRPQNNTYYAVTASPGHIIRHGDEFLMFFSASTDAPILRTIGIARTRDLDGPWMIDPGPILPVTEQVENTSLYYQEETHTWFLFTNHVGLKRGMEYTDGVWVYWTKDLEHWDAECKAIVLDRHNCLWSKEIIGLPSVVQHGKRLALFYDGYAGPGLPEGTASHMRRDVGLAWLELPLDVSGYRKP